MGGLHPVPQSLNRSNVFCWKSLLLLHVAGRICHQILKLVLLRLLLHWEIAVGGGASVASLLDHVSYKSLHGTISILVQPSPTGKMAHLVHECNEQQDAARPQVPRGCKMRNGTEGGDLPGLASLPYFWKAQDAM